MKCDLLHRKNSAELSDVNAEKKAESRVENSTDKKEEDDSTTLNVLHERQTSKDKIVTLTNNVRSLMMSTTTFKDERASVQQDKTEEE